MKVIDLLNKIAKGEEVPEKIKFGGEIWKKENGGKNYVYYTNNNYHDLFVVVFKSNNTYSMNDEVEIIEEEKEIKLSDLAEMMEKIIDAVNELKRSN